MGLERMRIATASVGGVHVGGVRFGNGFGNVCVDLRVGVPALSPPPLVRHGVTPPCGTNRNSQQKVMSGLKLRG